MDEHVQVRPGDHDAPLIRARAEARFAYEQCLRDLDTSLPDPAERKWYRRQVEILPGLIRRSGATAVLAALEETMKGEKAGKKAAKVLLEHLAGFTANLAAALGLADDPDDGWGPEALVCAGRTASVGEYMLLHRMVARAARTLRSNLPCTGIEED